MIVSFRQGKNYVASKMWTEDEDEFLKRNSHLALEDIAFLLRKKSNQVRSRYSVLKIQRVYNKKQFLTEEQIEFLRQNSSMPFKELSKILDRPISSLKYYYTRNRIQRTEVLKHSDEEVAFVKTHRDTMSNVELAAALNCSPMRISSITQARKIAKTKLDYIQYFDIECHQLYAYILGWLFADGNLCLSRYRMTLKIVKSDAEQISPYMFAIFPHWKVLHLQPKGERSQPQQLFSVSNKDLSFFFSKKWQLETKSFGLSDGLYDFIKSGGTDCEKCFLRGFFDGDGWVATRTMQVGYGKHLKFDWDSISRLFPHGIRTRIYKSVGTSRSNGQGSKMVFLTDSGVFLQYIYNTPCKAALPRKKNIALAHFAKPYYKEKYGELECPS